MNNSVPHPNCFPFYQSKERLQIGQMLIKQRFSHYAVCCSINLLAVIYFLFFQILFYLMILLTDNLELRIKNSPCHQ